MADYLSFLKMNGLGNEFIIIDSRRESFAFGVDIDCNTQYNNAQKFIGEITAQPDIIKNICNHISFDQLIIIEDCPDNFALPEDELLPHCLMRIFNQDGSEVSACGNATRCVAALLFTQHNISSKSKHNSKNNIVIYSKSERLICGLNKVISDSNWQISVNMGRPRFDWVSIPTSQAIDTQNIQFDEPNLAKLPPAIALNIGNPHIVFILAEDNIEHDITSYGPIIENHALFPERTNVEFITIDSSNHITMQVWERGAGITKACGTGACASAIAAVKSGKCDYGSDIKISMAGGDLIINWQKYDGSVIMSGDACYEYEGDLTQYID